MTLEHRAAKPPPPMVIDLVSGPDGDATHVEIRGDVTVGEPETPSSLVLQRNRS